MKGAISVHKYDFSWQKCVFCPEVLAYLYDRPIESFSTEPWADTLLSSGPRRLKDEYYSFTN